MSRKTPLLTWRRFVLATVVFVVVWYAGSYPRGMAMAYIDHARGHYEEKTYGYPSPTRWEYARLLKERYDVKLHAVAGCMVYPHEEWYVGGYNDVSEHLLLKKHGKDIFAECAGEASRTWRAEHPSEW
jgi:hypothetical protein